MIRAHVAHRAVLKGTIDGHDPLLVVLRVTGGLQPFWLVVVCANLGRGYSPERFRRNVMRIVDKLEGRKHFVLLLQEIDEADPADEHERLLQWMPEGCVLVGWHTREPIIVSPGVHVDREREVMTMDQGTRIGAPEGTGPRRMLVSCRMTIEGVKIGAATQHPHRSLPNEAVREARRRGQGVTRDELAELAAVCDLVVDGADWNDEHYPLSHTHQRELIRRRLDSIRLIDPPRR